jgi:hypothetical protein
MKQALGLLQVARSKTAGESTPSLLCPLHAYLQVPTYQALYTYQHGSYAIFKPCPVCVIEPRSVCKSVREYDPGVSYSLSRL